MAKRFFDSRKYQDPWFRKLNPVYKCFWDYILSTCSHTGIWKVDFEMAEFCIGSKLEIKVIKTEFSGRIVEITPEKWFIPKYLVFQYGDLNPRAPLHSKILTDLRVDLPQKVFSSIRVMAECGKSGNTPKAKAKAKDKVKVNTADFISTLKTDPTYSHINLDHEFGKMDSWLAIHPGRKKTPRFVINWLNKIEKPIGASNEPKIERGDAWKLQKVS